MNKKISRREKVMLGVLCIAAFITAYYNLIYAPQKQKIDTLIMAKAKYDEELTLISKEALNLQSIKKNTKIINANILGLSEDLLPPIAEEKLILIMNDLINKSQLSIGGFTITNTALESAEAVATVTLEKQKSSLGVIVDEYTALSNGGEKISKEDIANTEKKSAEVTKDSKTDTKGKTATESKNTDKVIGSTVEKVSISMGYQGSYDELNAFIKAVEDFPEKIIINNLTIAASETKVTGNLTLDFYFIPKINASDEYMPWMYKAKYGKDNPFKAIGGIGNNSSGKLEAEKKYDFRMMVKPTSSDLPTMILGKVGDASRSTYLYADNSGMESIEVYFTEVNGKYYYKYKNDNSSYPAKFNGNGIEFKQSSEEINIDIISIVRNSEEDVNGVNFKIYNNTNKKVYVKLEKDDKTRPRVMISGEKGNVYIEK
jgi:type IV pilus assembly protein PilO